MSSFIQHTIAFRNLKWKQKSLWWHRSPCCERLAAPCDRRDRDWCRSFLCELEWSVFAWGHELHPLEDGWCKSDVGNRSRYSWVSPGCLAFMISRESHLPWEAGDCRPSKLVSFVMSLASFTGQMSHATCPSAMSAIFTKSQDLMQMFPSVE